MVLIELVDGKWIKEKLDREQTSPQKSSIIENSFPSRNSDAPTRIVKWKSEKKTKNEANTRLKVTLKSLKNRFECNHFRSRTPANEPPVPDTQLSSFSLPHPYTLHASPRVSFMSNFFPLRGWEERNYRTTTDGSDRLDIFCSYTCIHIWLHEKKNNKKLLCFLFPHSTYSFHSTFNICSFYSEEFCGEFFFSSRKLCCWKFVFSPISEEKCGKDFLINRKSQVVSKRLGIKWKKKVFVWRRKNLIKTLVQWIVCVIATKTTQSGEYLKWIIHRRFKYAFGVNLFVDLKEEEINKNHEVFNKPAKKFSDSVKIIFF